jgi:hypothetical protein
MIESAHGHQPRIVYLISLNWHVEHKPLFVGQFSDKLLHGWTSCEQKNLNPLLCDFQAIHGLLRPLRSQLQRLCAIQWTLKNWSFLRGRSIYLCWCRDVFFFSISKTWRRCSKCTATDLLKMSISSKYTTMNLQRNSRSACVVTHINVLAALVRPNGMPNHSYSPSFVLKSVFHSSPGLTRIW